MTDFVAGAEQRLIPSTTCSVNAPSVAGLTGGGYAVTWRTDHEALLQVYDASGAAIGTETSLAHFDFRYSGFPAASVVAPLTDGGFAVSWSDLEFNVSAQVFDANGVARDEAYALTSLGNTLGSVGSSSITGLADGGFTVSWDTVEVMDIDDLDIRHVFTYIFNQSFNADGSANGGQQNISGSSFTTHGYPAPSSDGVVETSVVAGLTGGGHVAAWWVFDGDFNISAQVFDASGTPVGNGFNVNTTTDGDQYDQALAGLTGGGFVVVWTSPDQDGSGAGVYAQRCAADGTALGGETRVNTTTAGNQFAPTIAALHDGGYVVAWAGDHTGGSDIYAQRYDANGVAIGGEMRVSQVTEGGQGQPSITVLADGSYLIAWASGSGLYSRTFWPDDVAGQVITGTESADNLGGAAGNDTLIGLGGDDWLNGAPGNDLMQGGTGNDTYVVDDAGDVVEEAADAGLDTVRVSMSSYVLPDNVENLIYSGRRTFIGSGNALDNALTGGNANDRLSGGDGNDTLAGAAGADQLFGGRGHDQLDGGAGNDALYGGSGIDWLDGGLGNDMMAGGIGHDTYVVDSAGDQVVEEVDAGIDTVRTALAAFTLGDNVENLVFTGSGPFMGSGNALANALTGGAGNDELRGFDGNDTLLGEGGDDLLYGGRGHDALDGGDGNDQLFGGTGVDTLQGGVGNDRIEGGFGADILAGGWGHDMFMYRDVADSSGRGLDSITDFSEAGRDRINLAYIDANSTTSDNDRFTYVGAAAFSGVAGELRYDGALLQGDVNGDAIADLTIKVANLSPDGRDLVL